MNNPDDFQNDTNRENNNDNLMAGENLSEGNQNFEGDGEGENDQNQNQFQQHFQIEQNQPSPDDNSFHMDKRLDDLTSNDNFAQKEKAVRDKLDQILKEKSSFTLSSFVAHIFMLNKILLLITFTEFLFQRFDVVTLFLCLVVIFIELDIFSHKHLYKWLIVLISSLLLDALVLIDISPVR
jgi:ABC-type bacteriocin/lantibiotic exporter with double-glycine peptidase domain